MIFCQLSRLTTKRFILHPLIGLLIVLSLTGCADDETPARNVYQGTISLPTAAPPTEPTPIGTQVTDHATPTPTATVTAIPAESKGLVVDVISGDTISVVMQGDRFNQSYRVRYLGIEAPPNVLGNPWGIVAYERNLDLTRLKVVRLVRDQTEFDEAGNLLRYVYLGNTLLNVYLPQQGLAEAAIETPDTTFQDEILAAEAEARQNNLGLWGPPPTATTRPIRPTPRPRNQSTPLILVPPTSPLTATVTTSATEEPSSE